MGKIWGVFTGVFAFIGGLGGLLFTVASVTPEQMMSALAKWAAFIGAQMPSWAALPDIDQHAQVLGLEGLTIGALGIALTVIKRARLGVAVKSPRDLVTSLAAPETSLPTSTRVPAALPAPEFREFVDVSPQYLIDLYKGEHTSVQASSMFAIYKGKWMKIRRPIRDASEISVAHSMVTLQKQDEEDYKECEVLLMFSPEWTRRLVPLQRGAIITAIGKIYRAEVGILTLTDCEIINAAIDSPIQSGQQNSQSPQGTE